MDIQQEIIEYLNNNDFVLLPGIGGLTAEYTQPFLDADSNIVESKKVIKYLPYLDQETDTSFLKSLRDKYEIPTSKIQKEYFDFIDHFNQKLNDGGRYDWKGLGEFILENNIYHFASSDFEGKSEPIKNLSVKNQIVNQPKVQHYIDQIITTEPKSALAPIPDNLIPEQPVIEEYEPDEAEGIARKPNKILYFLPLVILFSAFVYNVFFKPIQEKTVIVEKEQVVATEEDQSFIDDEFSEVKTEEKNTEDKSTEDVTGAQLEHIVRVGYFRNNEEADDVATYLAENGYPSRVRPSGRMFKVFLVARNEEQALKYVEEVRDLINENPVYENQLKQ